jgi:hypothetical protein
VEADDDDDDAVVLGLRFCLSALAPPFCPINTTRSEDRWERDEGNDESIESLDFVVVLGVVLVLAVGVDDRGAKNNSVVLVLVLVLVLRKESKKSVLLFLLLLQLLLLLLLILILALLAIPKPYTLQFDEGLTHIVICRMLKTARANNLVPFRNTLRGR